MARRQRSNADQGPAVPRWAVEFDPARWGSVQDWKAAVNDWAKVNLHQRGEFGAWIDVVRNTYVVREGLRAR
ncbi:hypothetical protein GCM10011374_38690 [Kocuria dechangensis]|uniref:Uncharacterized protein n=1 Tax=Kocuria dechangensis TaxID=1176249 RepID=A0A917M279_9MICC|nr:hypothetical protein GCM10011374_38690 [Kocuria dechangensis]